MAASPPRSRPKFSFAEPEPGSALPDGPPSAPVFPPGVAPWTEVPLSVASGEQAFTTVIKPIRAATPTIPKCRPLISNSVFICAWSQADATDEVRQRLCSHWPIAGRRITSAQFAQFRHFPPPAKTPSVGSAPVKPPQGATTLAQRIPWLRSQLWRCQALRDCAILELRTLHTAVKEAKNSVPAVAADSRD